MNERPISHVPRLGVAFLVLSLVAQVAWQRHLPAAQARAGDLQKPPSLASLRLASLGEPIAMAKALTLYLQSFESQPGVYVPSKKLDYDRVRGWLALSLELDPKGQYPLFAASKLYAELGDEARQRLMLDFIRQQFDLDPNRRWPWLIHAAVIAKHRLHDLPLAREYAQAVRLRAVGPDVPPWVRQMEVFILEDMNELESAKVLLGGLLRGGQFKDVKEIEFMEKRLQSIEDRTRSK